MLVGERIITTSRVKHCPVCSSIDLKVHIEAVVPPLDQVPCNTKLLDDLRIIGHLYKERLISTEAFQYFTTIGFNFQTIRVCIYILELQLKILEFMMIIVLFC